MNTIHKAIITGLAVLIFLAGCGATEPKATVGPPAAPPPSPTATTAPPTGTPSPKNTPAPADDAVVAMSVSFTDSGQILGNERSTDVSLGDLDGDGDLDALVGNEGKAEVWFNDGQGIFSKSGQDLDVSSGWNMSLDLGDLDGDDDLDAFIVVFEGTSRVLLNDGGIQGGSPGTFVDSGQQLNTEPAFCITLGDLDGDGDLDAYVGQEQANTVWLNDGQGTFTDSGQGLGSAITAAVALADLDGDGDLDALVGGWDEPAKVWLNDGTGTFVDSGHDLAPSPVHIHGLALGDLDSDGDLDAFLAIASGHSNQVWLNDGTGIFINSDQGLRSSNGHGISLGDLDRDGDLDAYMANGSTRGSSNTVWLNDGRGTFTNSGLQLDSACSRSVALGDLDDDGDLDAFIANTYFLDEHTGKPNEIWLNGAP